jgi:hypothetical protein
MFSLGAVEENQYLNEIFFPQNQIFLHLTSFFCRGFQINGTPLNILKSRLTLTVPITIFLPWNPPHCVGVIGFFNGHFIPQSISFQCAIESHFHPFRSASMSLILNPQSERLCSQWSVHHNQGFHSVQNNTGKTTFEFQDLKKGVTLR